MTSQPITTAQAVALLPVALIVASIAYVVVGVRSMPPLKYHYDVQANGVPAIEEGPFDTLELCEHNWAIMSASLKDDAMVHYELTGCAPVEPRTSNPT